ncbi:hypothetical protein COCNU_scaffold000110G000050 [Cocos nucifera]|nr:hypothetical protein [Cocos nucifera]
MASKIDEVELKVIEAKKVAEEQIIKVGCLTMEAFKASKKFSNARIAFNQEAFNSTLEIDFDNYHHRVIAQLLTMDLSLLDENEEEEAVGVPIFSELTAIEEQVEEELVAMGFSLSLTIDASTLMPTPTGAPTGLPEIAPDSADPQNKVEN